MKRDDERRLTVSQRETLTAAVDCILSADDGGESPGAVEAGACGYIEETLAAPTSKTIRPWIRSGLDDLSTRSNATFGKAFAACSPVEQAAVWESVSRDTHWASRLFTRSLVSLTLEGFLGDPVHGANRQAMGWTYIGYDAERLRSGFCINESTTT